MASPGKVKALMLKRDALDRQLQENRLVLESNSCTMNSALVDEEGFPIATIDVYSVRHARRNIICLENDRKALNDKLQSVIEQLHEKDNSENKVGLHVSNNRVEEEKPVNHNSYSQFSKFMKKLIDKWASCFGPFQKQRKSTNEQEKLHSKMELYEEEERVEEKPVHRTSNTSFARISVVVPGSPADVDGFRLGDRIIQYGSLHYGIFNNFNQVAEITKTNQNKIVPVTVIRNDRPVRLQICPRKWNGNGLLGCTIAP